MSSNPKTIDLPSDIWEHLKYDAETGLFWWIKPKQKRDMNRPAGSVNGRGYSRICFEGKAYLAHRLAWAFKTGFLPKGEIDHINRDRSDNRFSNLRQATRLENCRNRNPARKSKSQSVGVRPFRGKWKAEIRYGGKKRHLGTFDTIEEAAAVRKVAAKAMYGEFAP